MNVKFLMVSQKLFSYLEPQHLQKYPLHVKDVRPSVRILGEVEKLPEEDKGT